MYAIGGFSEFEKMRESNRKKPMQRNQFILEFFLQWILFENIDAFMWMKVEIN